MISLSINVSKITKERLFQGKQGQYLDCVLIETPNSEYGDYMVVESITKQEREAGQKGVIIGNGKIIVKKNIAESDPADTGNEDFKGDASDLPF